MTARASQSLPKGKPPARAGRGHAEPLPRELAEFFWDYDFRRLSWETDQDLIIGRLLASGDWAALRWLRGRLGDAALRRWLEERRGRGLSPQQLRFWEVILGIPHRRVTAWLEEQRDFPWARRLGA